MPETINPTPENIILGDGAFYINENLIALTRGGGQFTVEREYRQIEADGDRGPVKGRIRKIKSTAKLKLNALELVPSQLVEMYPALQINSDAEGSTITAKEEIEATDYQDEIIWVGETLAGRGVRITIQNAINLENIDWGLVDKEEIVPEINYTATYVESARKTEPWQVEFLNSEY